MAGSSSFSALPIEGRRTARYVALDVHHVRRVGRLGRCRLLPRLPATARSRGLRPAPAAGPRRLAAGTTVTLPHPPLPSVDVSIGTERGRQQNGRALADSCPRRLGLVDGQRGGGPRHRGDLAAGDLPLPVPPIALRRRPAAPRSAHRLREDRLGAAECDATACIATCDTQAV